MVPVPLPLLKGRNAIMSISPFATARPPVILDADQQRAADWREGPVFVTAAAGAGKSAILIERVAALIKEGTPPERTLTLMYNTAAADMFRKRLEGRIGKIADRCVVKTFHSFSLSLLKDWFGGTPEWAQMKLLMEGESYALARKVIAGLGIRANSRIFLQATDVMREKMVDFENPKFVPPIDMPQKLLKFARAWQTQKGIENRYDFADMLYLTAKVIRKEREALEDYLKKFDHVQVDETQDLSRARWEVCSAFGWHAKSFMLVGDLRQCIPGHQPIETLRGIVPMADVRVGDQVASVREGQKVFGKVTNKSMTKKAEEIVFTLEDGRTFAATPDHQCFAAMETKTGAFVYLMYREDLGFRIGVTQTAEAGAASFIVRTQQEHADRMWVIDWKPTYSEAAEVEATLAYEYGIPREPFKSRPGIWCEDDGVRHRFFAKFGKNGFRLIEDRKLDFNLPSYWPKSSRSDRISININIGTKNGHEVAIESSLLSERQIIALGATPTTKGTHRRRIYTHSLRRAEDVAKEMADITGGHIAQCLSGAESHRRMRLVQAQTIFPGMQVPVLVDGALVSMTVMKAERRYVEQDCFDLEVENYGVFAVNGVVVHNCLYTWSGSDMDILHEFIAGADSQPPAKLIVLPTNRRSTHSIVALANRIAGPYEWHMGGDTKALPTADVGVHPEVWTVQDPIREADKVVELAQKAHLERQAAAQADPTGALNAPDRRAPIAVLCRTNAWGIIIEQRLMAAGIPVTTRGNNSGAWATNEGKDFMAYLQLVEGDGRADVARIANKPNRYLNKEAIDELKLSCAHADATNSDRLTSLLDALPSHPKRGAGELAILLSDLAELPWEKRCAKISQILRKDAKDRENEDKDVADYVHSSEDDDRGDIYVSLGKAAAGFGSYEALQARGKKQIRPGVPAPAPVVEISSIHRYKGDEADTVIVAGVCKDHLPHKRAADIEEEVRIWYVAATRARQKLIVSMGGHPSEFLVECGLVQEAQGPWRIAP